MFRPSVSGHGPSTRLYLSTLSRLSQGTANPYRVTPMVRPLVWQNPAWVTRPVPPGRLPFSSTFSSSGGSALRYIRIPSASSLSALTVRFQSVDLLLPVPASRPSPFAPDLSIFPVRFQSCDLLRPSCDPNLAIGWFLSTGGSSYSYLHGLSKPG
jgi:hypothetical protein